MSDHEQPDPVTRNRRLGRRHNPGRQVPGWTNTVRMFRMTAGVVALVTILLVVLLWPR